MEFKFDMGSAEVATREMMAVLSIEDSQIFEERHIPSIVHDKILQLSESVRDNRLKAECLMNKFNRLKAEGDFESAKTTLEEAMESEALYKSQHDQLWNTIYSALPEADQKKTWTLDTDDMKIKVSKEDTIKKYMMKKLGLLAKEMIDA